MTKVYCEKMVYPYLCQVLDKNLIIYEAEKETNGYNIISAIDENSFNEFLDEAKILRKELINELEILEGPDVFIRTNTSKRVS